MADLLDENSSQCLSRWAGMHFQANMTELVAIKSPSLPRNGFWFLVCYDATLLALQIYKECMQVLRSNRVILGHGFWWVAQRNVLVFGLLCSHTAFNPITSGTHTSGAQ